MTLDNFILVIPNLLSKIECETFISCYSKISNSFYERSYNTSLDRIDLSTASYKEILPTFPEYELATEKMTIAIKKWVIHLEHFGLFSTTNLKKNLNFPHSIRLIKYEKGQGIHPHVDYDDYHFASCTLNLNDTYDGGEFSFFNRKLDIKLHTGDALIFPNNFFYTHEVKEISRGTRFSINSFITSIPLQKIKAIKGFWKIEQLKENRIFRI